MSSEEDRARALLLAMQQRIADGPYAALELPSHATAADVRSAFLQLTKTFHPARFGRMPNEIQRLSNEVFLSLKAAYETLTKPKPSRSASTTAAPANRSATRPFGVPLTGRAPTPPSFPIPERRSGPIPVQQPPLRSGTPTPGTKPPPTITRNPGSTPPPTITRNPGSTPPPARPTPNPGPVRPTPNPLPQRQTPPTGVKFNTPAARPSTPTPGITPPARATGSMSMPVLDRELAPILELMGREQWDQAQHAIDALAARNPQARRYQALASYCRGRRAQLEQNFGDARVELSQALLLDPDLELAKTALNELFGRRK